MAQRFLSDINLGDNIYLRFGNREEAGSLVGDFTIRHSGANTFLTNTTGSLVLKNTADDKGIAFMADDGNGGATTYFELEADQSTYDTGSSSITALYTTWKDNSRIALGTHRDLLLYHDSSNSYIETSTGSAGDLYIKAQGTNHDLYLQAVDDIFIRPQGGENGIVVTGNAGVTLYYNSVSQAATISDGFVVPSGKGVYFDGGSHTYIKETASDVLKIFVGSDGEHASFSGGNTTFAGDVTVTGTDIRTGANNGLDLGDDSSVITIGRTNELWTQNDTDANATLYINHRGYNAGSTRFRSIEIRDGKGSKIVNFNGSDKLSSFAGDITVQQTEDVYLTLESTDTSTAEEVAVKYSNQSTGSNYWWVGLNQSANYSLAYGTAYSGANVKMEISTAGNVTFSGNAGVNVPSAYTANTAADDLVVGDGTSSHGITILSANANQGGIYFANDLDAEGAGDNPVGNRLGVIRYHPSDDMFQIRSGGNSLAVTISTGNTTFEGTITLGGGNFKIPSSIGSAGQVLKVPSSGTTLEWGAGATFNGGTVANATTFSSDVTISKDGAQLRLKRADGADDDWRFYSWASGLNIYPQTASTIFFGRDGQTADVNVWNGDFTVTSGKIHVGSGNPNGWLDVHANLGNWRVNSYGAMYFRNSSNATHESYIHSRSDGSLSIGRVAESDWTGSGVGAYAATTYDHVTFDTSSNASFAGYTSATSSYAQNFYVTSSGTNAVNRIDNDGSNLYITYGGTTTRALEIVNSNGKAIFKGNVDVVEDLKINPDYNNSNEYLFVRKHQSADGGIILQSKTSGGSTQSDWQIVNHASTGDLKFYAYGLADHALTLDREDGSATFAGSVNVGNPTHTSSSPDGILKGAGNDGTSGSSFRIAANGTNRRLWLGTEADDSAVTITGSNVGIGTGTLKAAEELLHIFSSAPILKIQDGGDKASNASGFVQFWDHDSQMGHIGIVDGGSMRINNINSSLLFHSSNILALTLDTSQNALFAANVNIPSGYVGRDSHNGVYFSTDDSIIYRVADSHRFRMDSTTFRPYTDSTYDLGTASVRWANIYTDAISVLGQGTFDTINTGQGATEVHLMNQNIRTTDNVTFNTGTFTGKLRVDVPGVALASQPLIVAEFDGSGTDGLALISIDHTTTSTAAALGSGIRFKTGDGTSGGSTKPGYIFMQGAGNSDLKYIAPRTHAFYVDHHDDDLTGSNYTDYGTLSLTLNENGSATFAGNVVIGTVDSVSTGLSIGEASPTIQLFDTTNDAKLLMYTQDNGSIIGTYSNHPLAFYTDSGLTLTLNTDHSATFAGDTFTPGLYVNTGGSAVSGTQVAIVSTGSSENLQRWGSSTSGANSYRFRIDQNFKFIGNNGGADKITIDSATGDIDTDGDITIGGNLYVTGTSTTVNVEDLNVEQGEITLNYGSGDTSSNANGAGIRIQDAVNGSTDAAMTWNTTGYQFNFSHGMVIGGTNSSNTVRLVCKDAGVALLQVGDSSDGSQGTGAIEVTQDGDHGGGISYNGDGSPSFASGETADHITFFRNNNGTRSEVFSYPYNTDNVTFNGSIVASGGISGLTLANGGISGSNYNISGVNQLSIADPGEGIVFGGGSSGNIVLAVTDDSSDNILAVTGGVSEFSVAGNVKHEGLTMTTGTDVDQVKQYNMTFQLTAHTWTDTGIDGTDLTTGTYAVQVYVDDHNVNGNHYDEHYSGIMSWYSANTNSSSVDEIVLHRAGHAPNAGDIQLRTQRTENADSHDLMLQIKHTRTYNAALDNSSDGKIMRFKFRRLI